MVESCYLRVLARVDEGEGGQRFLFMFIFMPFSKRSLTSGQFS